MASTLSLQSTRKKLIEVALPLEAINKASAREKSIRHGHPSTLHLWWARRPLAAARAVIFSQMVDDPSEYVDVLRGDPKLLRRAEKELKARHKLWQEAQALKEKADAAGISAPAPGPEPTLDGILAEHERQRLFKIIEDLVLWENTTNETVLQAAREEIWQSWRRTCAQNAGHPRAAELFDRTKLPAFHDPFAGGGALPLEAQRLGLESHASDLNPVAVLINKAMIEIPPKFAGRPPVNPEWRSNKDLIRREWKGAQGLAEDVRYYGKWMRDEAEKRIGHLYPKIEITAAMAEERPDLKPLVGQKLTVIAWLWARTVKSPNPAFREVDVPLATNFILTPMAGKETYVEPVLENDGYRFTVKVGKPKDAEAATLGTSAGKRSAFKCLMSGVPVTYDHIRSEGKAGRMGARLMAIVAEGERGRVYLSPTPEHEAVALMANPQWKPDCEMPRKHRNFQPPGYGMNNLGDIFTSRQLVALTTFSDLVLEAVKNIWAAAIAGGLVDDQKSLNDGGKGALAYAESVATYLGFVVGKLADKGSSICTWDAGPTSNRTSSGRSARVATVRVTFGRQALPMTWDYAEVNFFSESVGSIETVLKTLCVPLTYLPKDSQRGNAEQMGAQSQTISSGKLVSTDPPYYDNISYADLSDFFYVWLRRTLRSVFPSLFATLAVPKSEELIASPNRHGGQDNAEAFFLEGMTRAMHRLADQSHAAFPVTIYYAFKQSENEVGGGSASTGWETFLDAVIRADLGISGTWPMRTEMGSRMIGRDANALASSIVLVCRPRAADAPTATRREFVAALQRELPEALRHLQAGNIAPVDLAQAAIGPGMAVFTRYAKVLDAQGNALTVREALALINETLDTALAEQEGDFDPDSRWALAWFDQSGFEEGEYGVAETLSKAKNTSISGLAGAGILESARGKVRLLRPEELPADWDPATDPRLTHWETVHHLIRTLAGGEAAAADLVGRLGAKAEPARELAYRLYTLCERKKRAAEALAYNGLVQAWPDLLRLAEENPPPAVPVQGELL
jgi:putative DNA methylase